MIIRSFLRAGFFSLLDLDFLLASSFRFRSMKFLSTSPSFFLYLSFFKFSFSFNLNNSFGRPLHRISNKIVGTIFVRPSFLIPTLLAIPLRLSVCLQPSTLSPSSPSTFRLIWPQATPACHYRELSVSQSSINFFGPQSVQRQAWRSIWHSLRRRR